MFSRRRNNRPRTFIGTFKWDVIGEIVGNFFKKVMIRTFVILFFVFVVDNTQYTVNAYMITKRQENAKIEEQKEKDRKLEEQRIEREHERIRKEYELAKEREERLKQLNSRFKKGDRIKVLDLNMAVEENGKNRLSVGAIGVVDRVEDYKVYCDNGDIWSNDETIQKVQSKREWRDLVNMSLEGKLKFYEELEKDE